MGSTVVTVSFQIGILTLVVEFVIIVVPLNGGTTEEYVLISFKEVEIINGKVVDSGTNVALTISVPLNSFEESKTVKILVTS